MLGLLGLMGLLGHMGLLGLLGLMGLLGLLNRLGLSGFMSELFLQTLWKFQTNWSELLHERETRLRINCIKKM